MRVGNVFELRIEVERNGRDSTCGCIIRCGTIGASNETQAIDGDESVRTVPSRSEVGIGTSNQYQLDLEGGG